MFADDANLFFSHKDVDVLIAIIHEELAKIANWFRLNKLSLNLKRTHFIRFYPAKHAKKSCSFKISVDGIDIEEVIKTKFLGVMVNQTLSWNDHIALIKHKI
jgi:hypothetical protein